MIKKIFFAFVGSIFFIFQSCITNRSFVASGYEPLNVTKQGDVEVSASVRPMKYAKFNGTIALTNWLAIRGGYGGTYQLDNFDASILVFKSLKKVDFFVGPSYNYQHNLINRGYSASLFGVGKRIQYNCEYNSPSLVMGIKLFRTRRSNHQIIVKPTYNIVKQYKYLYSEDNASGRNSGYIRKDYEYLNYKIPNFISVEASYSYLESINSLLDLRFQIGLNFCETTLNHKYSFNSSGYGTRIKDASTLHPVYIPINMSIGIILKHSFNKKQIDD